MGANRRPSKDHDHDQFAADGAGTALRAKPPGSKRVLDCPPLLPAGCPPSLAGNRVGQRRSAIPHSCRRGGAGRAKGIEQMNGLAVSQENFAVALLDPLARVPAAIPDVDLRARNAPRHAGIDTFLIRALAARYPVVRRLLGDDSFLDVARRFVAMQPPRLPIVQHFGEMFPLYLRNLGDAVSFEYVADMAELEAARTRAYHSADASPIDAQ